MSTIDCIEHGQQVDAAVCGHIVQTLKDRKARGFLAQIDDDGGHSAICTYCNEMPIAEWERTQRENFAIVCFECYRKAAKLNGVEIPGAKQ